MIECFTGREIERDIVPPTLNSPLGRGSFGTVFPHHDQPSLAVKCRQIWLEAKEEGEAFLQEFAMGSSLRHKNLVASYSLFTQKPSNPNDPTEHHRIVMERVYGATVDQLISRQLKHKHNDLPMQGLMPEDLFRQIHECALYLFRQKVVWGDLHSNNVMITDDNPRTVKFLDFAPPYWYRENNPKIRAIQLYVSSMHLDYLLEVCSPYSRYFDGDERDAQLRNLTSRLRHMGCTTEEEAEQWLKQQFQVEMDGLLKFLADKKESERECILEAWGIRSIHEALKK